MSRTRTIWSIALVGVTAALLTAAVSAQYGAVAPAGLQGLDGPAILGGDATPDIIVSPGSGVALTRVLNGVDGTELGSGYPFGPGWSGGVRTAAGDLTGDGVADLVIAMGPGGGLVTLLNGQTLASLGAGYPFGPSFGGGVSVAVGDVNADGTNDIVVGQASGGGAVLAFSGSNLALLTSLTPFGPGYTGGVNLAVGDYDGDRRADIFAGQASGGAVVLVNSATNATVVSVTPFPGANGVFTAMGDVTGDGRAEVMAAPGSGNGPVLVYDVTAASLLASFSPYAAGLTGGVRLAATDLTGDGRAEILTVPGPGITSTVNVYNGNGFALLRSFPGLAAGFTGGAFIAAPGVSGVQFSSAAAATFTAGSSNAFNVRAIATPPVTTLGVSGSLPSGVTFSHAGSGSGTLAGTPGTGTGGTYPLTFTASNGASTQTQTFALTVNEASAITSAASTSFSVGAPSTFTITTRGFPRPTLTLSGALPTGISFTANPNGSATIAGTPATGTAGSYPVTISASNGVGATATQSFVLSVQSTPVVTSATSTTFTVGAAGTFSITTSASPAVTSITRTGSLPGGVTFTDNGNGTATLAGTPAAGVGGSYPLTFTATNTLGSGTQNFTLTVNQAPAITSSATTTFAQGAAGSFSVTTTGFPRPTITRTGALPTGVTFVDNGNGSATLAGTPALGSGGTYVVTLQASNGVGAAASQSFTLQVTEAARFTSGAATTFTTGAAGSFTVVTAGGPTPAITRSGTLPSGVTFVDNGNGTATLAGTPAAGTGGTYALVLTATNGVGVPATQNFTLTVNQAPAITSGASTAFTVLQAGTFTITSTGFPAATVSVTGTLPSGVTFTPNGGGTGTLAGTPALGTDGAYPLVVSASNGVGSPATQNFTLTVTGCAITVQPVSSTLTAATYGQAYSQTFTATGGSGFTFGVTAGALPGGLTLASGGALTGSPTATGSFNFTVTATASGGCTGTRSYSLTVAPNAQNESFNNGVGNTQYVVGAGAPSTPAVVVSGSVLSNDAGPGSLTAGPANIASTNAGQVTMNANGSFVYTPAAGFAGPSDTFTYTLTDGNGATDTAVVTINLSGVVWYVNAAAGGGGDGRSQAPFTTMTTASTAAQASQVIYVHPGSPAGATTLKASQLLQGAGETFVLNGLTIAAGAAPSLQGTVALANGAAVRALSVNGNGAVAVTASGLSGTETLTNVTITGGTGGLALTNVGGTFTMTGGAISGVSGAGVAMSGGTGTATIAAPITSTTARAVDIQGRTAGTVTFSGAIDDTGQGIRLDNNTGSTIAFTGGLALATTTNDAFTATGGGTVTATQNNTTIVNTIVTTTGHALRVVNTQIGAAGLTFRSITAGESAPSAGNGIVLDTTGIAVGNGGLTVVGNGPTPLYTGGTIRRKSGADGSTTSGNGVYLNSTKNVSFAYMNFYDFDNSAIVGRNVNGFTLSDSVIEGAIGTNASQLEGPLVFGAPNPSGVNGIVGTATVTNSLVQGGVEHNIELYGQSGTAVWQMSGTTPVNCQITDTNATTGGDGLRLQFEGTATATVTVNACRFRDIRGAGVRGLATGDAALTVTIDGAQTVRGGEGVLLTNGGNADLTATVNGSLFTDVPGHHVYLAQVPFDATAQAMLRGTITGNTAYQANTVVPTAYAYGARLSSTVGQVSQTRLQFANNYIEGEGTPNHLVIETPDAGTTPQVDVTVTGNRTDVMNQTNGLHGIVLDATLSGAATNVCAAISNNLVLYPPDDTNYPPTAVNSIVVSQGNGTTVRLERAGSLLTDPAGTVLQSNNNNAVNSPPTVVNGTVTVVENGTCLLPSAP